MSRKSLVVILILVAATGAVVYFVTGNRSQGMVLTGIVTTDEVIVSSQIAGRLDQVLVKEGDTVTAGQLLAVIAPEELKANRAYYAHNLASSASQVNEAEAALRYQSRQTREEIQRQEATLAALQASAAQARAQLDRARLDYDRASGLFKQGITSAQVYDQARTTLEGQQAQLNSLEKQVEAQRAAVALAKSAAEQISIRQSQLAAQRHQEAAVQAQKEGADVQLNYTEIRAPIPGLVAVRAALTGEVVNPSQPVVVLYNPDELWVRADVEESLIDRIRLGDKFPVHFPSGSEQMGTVYFRGVDADYATQRDVSRTKRDIKTFEIRLRVDNSSRKLAPGLTAFVNLPF